MLELIKHTKSFGEQFIDFFSKLLGTESWPPRWHCGNWSEFHGWLYIISDLAIWASYFAIPILLLRFVTKKSDIPLPSVFWLFGAFILLCGLTHLIDAVIFWFPMYRLSALTRFVTAIISIITVISLVKLLPAAFSLKTSKQFEEELEKRKLVEASLIEAKNKAQESEQTKEQFLANMSHEIRTPMSAIIGFSQLFENSNLTDEERVWMNAIRQSGENLLVIINDILDFSKINADKMEFEIKPIDLKEITENTLIMFSEKVKTKGIGFNINIDKNLPNWVMGDRVRISQIILNLVSNAIKFTEVGEVNVYLQLEHEFDDKIILKLNVTDTGIGIPEIKHQLVFETFTQATPNTNSKFGGTGLGLPITKKLIELMGGSIDVFSSEGKGSTFIAHIPLEKTNELHIVEKQVDTESSKSEMEHLSILVVDDNILNLTLAKAVFKRWNVAIETAEDGRIAVDKISNGNFDLVLMDIQMPVMNGYEATFEIRNKLKLDIPIIAMTAHALTTEVDKCIKAGMNDYVSKPFDVLKLKEVILKHTRE